MGRHRVTAAALAVLVLAACGVRRGIDVMGPDFSGARYTRMHGNVLPMAVGGIGAIELNGERVDRLAQSSRAEQSEAQQRQQGNQRATELPPTFALLVEVRAEGLRIRQGESLELTLDGRRYRLLRDSLVTEWPRVDPSVREQARYPTPDSIMRQLGVATEVRMGVRGAGWWERRRVSGRSLAALQAFVREQVPADSLGG